MTFKHITKDDPEFLELCKKITPIEQVRKEYYGKTEYIDADIAPKSKLTRRNEDVHKNRG